MLLSKVGAQKEKGTDFDLQICKEFVELLGGKLSLESNNENGTIVRVVFPKY